MSSCLVCGNPETVEFVYVLENLSESDRMDTTEDDKYKLHQYHNYDASDVLRECVERVRSNICEVSVLCGGCCKLCLDNEFGLDSQNRCLRCGRKDELISDKKYYVTTNSVLQLNASDLNALSLSCIRDSANSLRKEYKGILCDHCKSRIEQHEVIMLDWKSGSEREKRDPSERILCKLLD